MRHREDEAEPTAADVPPVFDLRWPRPTYRIQAEPDIDDVAGWGTRLPKQRVPFFDPQPSEPWVWVGRDTAVRGSAIYGHEMSPVLSAADTINVYRLRWPVEGIFVATADDGIGTYEPLAEAPTILLDVQHTVKSPDADTLLAFVNRWGRLGVGIPGAEDFATDGVGSTRHALVDLARWIGIVHALQQRERIIETWADVDAVFRQRLSRVHVQSQVTRRGLLPAYHVPRLIDGLYLELWDVATRGKRLRACKRCEDFFIRGREDQIFCTPRCARLWHVKRWKQQQRAKRQRAGRAGRQRR